MPTGLLIGPYARQVVGERLKFWFAFKCDDSNLIRYEAAIDPRKPLRMRNRGEFRDVVPREPCNFIRFAIPDDLSGYRSMHYPRIPQDNLTHAVIEMLRLQYVADLTRARIGIPPIRADHGRKGDLL